MHSLAHVPLHTDWHGYERDHIFKMVMHMIVLGFLHLLVRVCHFICCNMSECLIISCHWHHLTGVSATNMVWYFTEKCLWVTTVKPKNLKTSRLCEWNESYLSPFWYINTRYNTTRQYNRMTDTIDYLVVTSTSCTDLWPIVCDDFTGVRDWLHTRGTCDKVSALIDTTIKLEVLDAAVLHIVM